MLKTDQFSEKLLATGQLDDKLYAVPLASNTQTFAVDSTVVEPLGLVPPQDGWASWEEFGDWAKKVTDATGKKVWGTRDESANVSAFEYWLRQNGKELYDGQKPGFTAEDVTAWLQLWADLRESGAASPPEISQPANSGDISKNTVATKQTAATFSYDNQLTELAKATDHQLVLAPLPGSREGAYDRPSQFFTAYARGENAATAVDVINFFVNDEEAGKVLGTERGLPPNAQVREAITPTFSDQLKYVVDFHERVVGEAGDTPPVPAQGDAQLGKLLITASENAAFGRQPVAQAAEEFVSQVTSELERAAS